MEIDKIIRQVDSSMAMEDMPLTEEDRQRIQKTLQNPASMNIVVAQLVESYSIPFSHSISSVPIARDEMDESAFHAMIKHGMEEAKADKSLLASDVFADLCQEML